MLRPNVPHAAQWLGKAFAGSEAIWSLGVPISALLRRRCRSLDPRHQIAGRVLHAPDLAGGDGSGSVMTQSGAALNRSGSQSGGTDHRRQLVRVLHLHDGPGTITGRTPVSVGRSKVAGGGRVNRALDILEGQDVGARGLQAHVEDHGDAGRRRRNQQERLLRAEEFFLNRYKYDRVHRHQRGRCCDRHQEDDLLSQPHA